MAIVEETREQFTVSRSAYWSDEVFQLELERLFKTSWLFLGHESEIPESGDYVLRRLGTDPVILTRDEDGTVQVLANTCRHRGVRLCRSDRGNSSHFRCPYHGWTYANSGELIGVTHVAEVYGKEFDKGPFSLYRPPKVQSVFGLVFACWDESAPSLEEYLGDALWYLESVFGKWDEGVEVLGTPMRTLTHTNWKPESENIGGDGYHTPSTHQSAFILGMFAGPDDWKQMGDVIAERYIGRVVVCENGHTFRVHHLPVATDPPSFFGYPPEMWPEMRRNLDDAQIDVQARLSILHGNVFPNLTLMENFKTSTESKGSACRYIRLTLQIPVSPTENEMVWWGFVPKTADAAWRRESQNANLRTVGPAGLFQIDDTENYVGFADSHSGSTIVNEHILLNGGLTNAVDESVAWKGTVYAADKSEQTQRAFWRRWNDVLGLDNGRLPAS